MIRTTRTTRLRRGTTLVELMVAAAMLIMGMWLLVWIYQQGMNGFLQAKSQATLTGEQRNAVLVMQRDLDCAKFLDEDAKPNHGRYLADQRTDSAPNGWAPPRGGFFRGRSTPIAFPAYARPFAAQNPNNFLEAYDNDGFTSARATDHALQFSIIVPGGPSHQMLSAEVPARSGRSWYGTAAEVTYVLVPSGRKTATGLPLFDLVRRQRLSAKTTDDAPAYATMTPVAPAAYADAPEVMVANGSPGTGTPNASTAMGNLGDLTIPNGFAGSVRLDWAPPAPGSVAIQSNSARYGEGILLSNVISMEVKFTGPTVPRNSSQQGVVQMKDVGPNAWPQDANAYLWPRPLLGPISPYTNARAQDNPDFPYDNLPFNSEFDTFTTRVANWQNYVVNPADTTTFTRPVKPIRITGVMIRIRTYEGRNMNTRQTTVYSKL